MEEQLKEAELRGMQKAQEKVEGCIKRYQKAGLNPFNFFIGMMNIVLTVTMVMRFPEYYWLYQVPKAIIMLILMILLRIKKKEMYYFCEFCWVCSFLFMFWGIMKLLKSQGITTRLSDIEGISEWGFFLMWGFANGPLAVAALMLHNALIVHHLGNMASMVIHFSPSVMTWCLRWNVLDVEAAWPDVFGMPLPHEESQVTFWNIFLPAFYTYLAWSVCWTIWMILHGRFQGRYVNGQNTQYDYDMRKNGFMIKFCFFDENNQTAILPIILHQVWHGMGTALVIAFSYLFFHNFYLHTAYIFGLFTCCTWNGAVRYNKMMTKFFKGSMKALIKETEEKKEN